MSGNFSSGQEANWEAAPLPLRAMRGLSIVCGWTTAAMLAAAILVTCHLVFVRYALQESTIWQHETVKFLVIGATLIGLPYVQQRRGHVNVELLPMLLPPTGRFILAIFIKLLSIAVIGYVGLLSYTFWHEAWVWNESTDSEWSPKLWIPYFAMPLGFGLFLLQLIADLLMLLLGYERPFGLTPEDDAASPKSAEQNQGAV